MKIDLRNYFSSNRGEISKIYTEYIDLLESLNKPAIIFNPESHKIYYANLEAIDQLDITLSGKEYLFLEDILMDLDVNVLLKVHTQIHKNVSNSVIHKASSSHKVLFFRLIYIPLPPNGEYGLLICEPTTVTDDRLIKDTTRYWKFTHQIASAAQLENSKKGIEEILNSGRDFTDSPTTAIYIAGEENPSATLNITSGNSDWLPKVLSPEDLFYLKSPRIWKSGNRIRSSLHNSAFKHSIPLVATAPLGDKDAMIGVVTTISKRLQNGEFLLDATILMALLITSIIQNQSKFINNNNTIKNQSFNLNVYNSIEQTINESVILLDLKFNIHHLNRAAENIFGYNAQSSKGRPITHILVANEGLVPALEQVKSDRKSIEIEGIRLYRRSGEAFPAKLNIFPIEGDQEIRLIGIVVTDLSDQEQIRAHANQLEQHAFLGEVSAIFAHEVRNPINNISTGLELLSYNLPENDPNNEIIIRLQSDCERLEVLMKSILTFAKPDDYTMVNVDITLLVNRLIEQFKTQFNRNNIELNLQIDQNLPLLRGNYRALEQVITNLIDNAIQAMRLSGGKLAIKIQKVREAGDRELIHISVADTGPGIPKDEIDFIFQPFYSTKRSGTGLGLAISKRIVTAHKGNIRVNSVPGGTIFQVQIPITDRP